MNRAQFDQTFAATIENTEGFTQAQLNKLNELVFDSIRTLFPFANRGLVEELFDLYSRHFDVRNA